MSTLPSRGEIWGADLNPVRGHEQAGVRPCLVVSTDPFNHGPAELVLVVPITSRDRHNPLHVAIAPPESNLRERSFIKCEDLRSVSRTRLRKRIGSVAASTIAEVQDRLRILLEL